VVANHLDKSDILAALIPKQENQSVI
jgi:hypothetical protein